MALVELPASLGRHLPSLKELAINTNSLQQLPESVGQLRALQSLIVRYNLLTSLPPFGPLPNLAHIDVSNNHLTALPESIGALAHLQTLDAHANELSALPGRLCELRELRKLILRENKLGSLPEAIASLQALSLLDVSSNALRQLPPSVGYLGSRLLELDVSRNLLTELPPSLGELRGLQRLRASANPSLSTLPSFSGLLSLKALDVEACAVAELPSVSGLEHLRELKCAKNPLQKPPLAVATQGLEAIKRYFVELELVYWRSRLAHCTRSPP